MTAASAPTIVVVGAGLAGLATSLGLAKKGYHVELIDRRNDWVRQGSAFGLAASGRKALQELCPEVLEKLLPQGIYMDANNSHLFGWWMVRDALLEQVEANPHISLHMGWTLQSLDDTSDQTCVQVTFCKSKDESETCVWKGVLLVGADGVYSTLRGLLCLEPAKQAKKTRWRGALRDIPKGSVLEPLLEKGVAPFYTDESTLGLTRGSCILSLFNFHPKIPRQMAFVFSVDSNDVPPKTHPRELFQSQITDLHQRAILEEVYRLAEEDDLLWPLPMSVIVLPEKGNQGWGGKGRVTLVGDAAHALRPASGLGGALAFEDAVVLCRLLSKDKIGLTSRDSADQVVRNFETSRFARVQRIWEDQWAISEKVYSKDGKIAEWTPEFREWVEQGV
jgi:2-polyprenyl-6-methoxyphenol hydroxylase-like FAD-dependent oxidoreductase